MNFLVIGCGSIGQRHIKNLCALGHKVTGCEVDSLRVRHVRKIYNIEIFNRLERALINRYDAAFICTPTSLHVPVAIDVAKKDINLFIEKPISNTLERIKELSIIVNNRKLVVLVACNTRFLPSFGLAKELIDKNKIGKILSVKVECGFYLPYWHPHRDYRKSYSANKYLGGGVIFDDIHDLDSLCWLFGKVKEVFCCTDKISRLKIDTEDIAEIFLRFKSGIFAQIHFDYLQRTYRRYYEFIRENGVIIWDYINQKVELYSRKTNQSRVFYTGINVNHEIMFIKEIKHFINCIRGRERSVNDISSARKTLELALACYDSAQKKRIVVL
jgi:predicted dehydrogenase